MHFLTHPIDLDLFLFVNQTCHNAVFNVVMPILSSKGVMFGLIALIFLYVVFRYGKRHIPLFLVLIIGMGINDYSTNFVKKQVERVRPLNAIASTYYQEDGEWRQRPADFKQTKTHGRSYPSAHSSNTMCLALLAMLLWPRLKKWPLLLPLLVGFSRLYLGKHYPSDVVAGWLFGIVTGTSVWLLWHYCIERYLYRRAILRQ